MVRITGPSDGDSQCSVSEVCASSPLTCVDFVSRLCGHCDENGTGRQTDLSGKPNQRYYSRAQERCESLGGRPGLPVPNKPYGFCGRKATLNLNVRAQELCENRCGRPGLPAPDSSYGFCGRKATLNLNVSRVQELCESRGGRPGLPVPKSPFGLCERKPTLN